MRIIGVKSGEFVHAIRDANKVWHAVTEGGEVVGQAWADEASLTQWAANDVPFERPEQRDAARIASEGLTLEAALRAVGYWASARGMDIAEASALLGKGASL